MWLHAQSMSPACEAATALLTPMDASACGETTPAVAGIADGIGLMNGKPRLADAMLALDRSADDMLPDIVIVGNDDGELLRRVSKPAAESLP